MHRDPRDEIAAWAGDSHLIELTAKPGCHTELRHKKVKRERDLGML
jgi:hypothetical protein